MAKEFLMERFLIEFRYAKFSHFTNQKLPSQKSKTSQSFVF